MGRDGGSGTQQGGFPARLTSKKLRAQPLPAADGFTAPGVLSINECQAFIDAAEAVGFQHQSSRGPAYGEAFRDNQRISFQDEALAASLWKDTGLCQLCQGLCIDGMVPIGLNPNLRFYRYDPGQKFGKHIDESVEVSPGYHTMYTLLIYLSGQATSGPSSSSSSSMASAAVSSSSRKGKGASGGRRGAAGAAAATAAVPAVAEVCTSAVQDLQGGETAFYGPRGNLVASVQPAPGLAILHLHWEDRCLEHEAKEVKKGFKYVLRSDVVFTSSG